MYIPRNSSLYSRDLSSSLYLLTSISLGGGFPLWEDALFGFFSNYAFSFLRSANSFSSNLFFSSVFSLFYFQESKSSKEFTRPSISFFSISASFFAYSLTYSSFLFKSFSLSLSFLLSANSTYIDSETILGLGGSF